MNTVTAAYQWLVSRLGSSSRFYWLVLLIGLGATYLLARQVEPDTLTAYKQLLALFAVDSLLFFLVDRFHAKMGILTLIFLLIMELFVILFYVLSLYSGAAF